MKMDSNESENLSVRIYILFDFSLFMFIFEIFEKNHGKTSKLSDIIVGIMNGPLIPYQYLGKLSL